MVKKTIPTTEWMIDQLSGKVNYQLFERDQLNIFTQPIMKTRSKYSYLCELFEIQGLT